MSTPLSIEQFHTQGNTMTGSNSVGHKTKQKDKPGKGANREDLRVTGVRGEQKTVVVRVTTI